MCPLAHQEMNSPCSYTVIQLYWLIPLHKQEGSLYAGYEDKKKIILKRDSVSAFKNVTLCLSAGVEKKWRSEKLPGNPLCHRVIWPVCLHSTPVSTEKMLLCHHTPSRCWNKATLIKLLIVYRSNKSSLVNVYHSSKAANRPVFVRMSVVSHKSICVEEMVTCEELQRGTVNVFPSQPHPCHGWKNRGEECERVNSDNAELCSS